MATAKPVTPAAILRLLTTGGPCTASNLTDAFQPPPEKVDGHMRGLRAWQAANYQVLLAIADLEESGRIAHVRTRSDSWLMTPEDARHLARKVQRALDQQAQLLAKQATVPA